MDHTYNYSNYMVSFIDILGQKSSFVGLPPIYDGAIESRNQITKAHKETALFIDLFRKSFADIFDYQKVEKPTIPIPDSNRELFLELRKVKIEYYQFSDSIEVFIPLEGENYFSPIMNGVHSLFVASCGVLLFLLANGKSMRAGIEVGIGTKLQNGDVYGPVLHKAYDLESKKADYPRIIIGPMAWNFLTSVSNKIEQFTGQIEIDKELCKINADKCLKLLKQDSKGYYFLDFLGEEMNFYLDGVVSRSLGKSRKDLINTAFEFVESEYKKFQSIGCVKLEKKYLFLREYFISRMSA